MGKVTFTYTDDRTHDRYHYLSDQVGDQSGDYYPAAEYDKLQAELKTANIKIEALNKLIQIHQTYQREE